MIYFKKNFPRKTVVENIIRITGLSNKELAEELGVKGNGLLNWVSKGDVLSRTIVENVINLCIQKKISLDSIFSQTKPHPHQNLLDKVEEIMEAENYITGQEAVRSVIEAMHDGLQKRAKKNRPELRLIKRR